MKIALISSPMLSSPPLNYGGLEQVIFDLACALAEKGHKVVLFTTKGSGRIPNGFVYECCEPMGKVHCDWLKAERNMYEIYKDKLSDFDIVHGMNWFGFEYLAKAEGLADKVCHTHHGGVAVQWWKRSTPPFKLNFIAISEWMKKVYASVGINAEFVYNGINLANYPYQKKKGNRLLFVGRMDSFKQPHVAIEVAKKLNMGLDLVGGTFVQDVAYLNNIRSLVANDSKLKMYENVSHAEKVKFYQNAKCVLFPSKLGEPFGLIVPEANNVGTSVVALNDGAIPETLSKGGGVVCADVDAMVDAVKNIVPKITARSCRRNAERFSRENMCIGYLELYKRILQGREW